MACFHPMLARLDAEGRPRFIRAATLGESIPGTIRLSCGQCSGCRLESARQWAVRCVHEAQLHESNSFITLTYDDEHLPPSGSLQKSDWQKFARRFRKQRGKFRYFHCGEYGDRGRPHYHAAIFGHDFLADRVHFKMSNGHELFRSASLEKLWPNGFSTIGELTFESASYVAQYVLKKVTGDKAEGHYNGRQPEYVTMSRRPGIAHDWLERFRSDVYPSDEVISNGRPARPPTYYDNLQAIHDPVGMAAIKLRRGKAASTHSENNTRARLDIREEVQAHRQKDRPRDL